MNETPIEADPNGMDAHAPGAKLDAGKNRLGLMLFGFAHALEEIGRVTTYGAKKYTENGWMLVENGRARYTDAMLRHLLREATGEQHDPETGLRHAAHAAWNALARLELEIASARLGVGATPPAAAPGIDLQWLADGLDEIGSLSRNLRQGGCDAGDLEGLENGLMHAVDMAHDLRDRLLAMIDASPKVGSEARALLDALVSLVAVARRYLPDYDEHPEVQKADDAIDAAMQTSDAEVSND